MVRDNDPLHGSNLADLLMILDDIVWTCRTYGMARGYSLSSLLDANAHKVLNRQAKGTIGGSGDER